VIEGLPKFFLLSNRPDEDPAISEIDFGDLMQNAGVDAVVVAKCFGRNGDEPIDVVDNLADIIGNASGRIGRMGSFLEGDNLQVRFEPLCLGRRAHPRCVPADDNKSFL
jgi:hypothetical protein